MEVNHSMSFVRASISEIFGKGNLSTTMLLFRYRKSMHRRIFPLALRTATKDIEESQILFYVCALPQSVCLSTSSHKKRHHTCLNTNAKHKSSPQFYLLSSTLQRVYVHMKTQEFSKQQYSIL
ncbi:hypothetical protein NDU88_001175 [Pleurodeles waltl]|uniref:Uncharacterized protein n=1 Tax=Pleurodeles waltl TaxID=8319 RepID=A0AAV7U9L3_PLEWA|nr:hypothetical protein NDU88_001175 [Pleurodeles waltl]